MRHVLSSFKAFIIPVMKFFFPLNAATRDLFFHVTLSPTLKPRYDISVEGVNGSACGYCLTIEQAESWADGIRLALIQQHKISSQNNKNGIIH